MPLEGKQGLRGVPFAFGSLQSLPTPASSCFAELAFVGPLPLCAPWAASPPKTLLPFQRHLPDIRIDAPSAAVWGIDPKWKHNGIGHARGRVVRPGFWAISRPNVRGRITRPGLWAISRPNVRGGVARPGLWAIFRPNARGRVARPGLWAIFRPNARGRVARPGLWAIFRPNARGRVTLSFPENS